MDENNWKVVAPMSFWDMPKFSIHYFQFLMFVALESHLMYEIRHQDQHDDMSIFLEDFSCSRAAFTEIEKALRNYSSVLDKSENVDDSSNCKFRLC